MEGKWSADGCECGGKQTESVEQQRVKERNICIKSTADTHCSCFKEHIRRLNETCLQWKLEHNSHFPLNGRLKNCTTQKRWSVTAPLAKQTPCETNPRTTIIVCFLSAGFSLNVTAYPCIPMSPSSQPVLLFRLRHILNSRSAPQSRQPTPLSQSSHSLRVVSVWCE